MFADSAALTEVVLLLLYDVNQRRQIERRAVSYMLQDQARAQVVMDQQVVPSALSHLVSAVNKLAGGYWMILLTVLLPLWNSLYMVMTRYLSADRWPESVSTDCSNRRFGRKAPHPATCEHDIQPNPPHTDGITAKQDSLEWLECQCRSSTFTDMIHTRPLLYSSIVRTGNASSPCFRRMDTSLLIGYLVKRYNYTGRISRQRVMYFGYLFRRSRVAYWMLDLYAPSLHRKACQDRMHSVGQPSTTRCSDLPRVPRECPGYLVVHRGLRLDYIR